MNKEDKQYLIALSTFQKFGPIRLKRLRNYFSNFQTAFNANANELLKAGIEESVAQEFIVKRKEIIPEKIMELLAKEEIETIVEDEADYPKLLKQIYDPPTILYYKGRLKLREKILAVVGSRKSTPYGQKIIDLLIPPLVANEITIASGLAVGIDALAQTKTADLGGRTIGVLGSGLDKNNFYPTENYLLSKKIIAQGGMVISEFSPGTPPLKQNFPRRNRIIAGLSSGVLVVEANVKSGSLITARLAAEEGREVLTVPGNIFVETSYGPNNLIKQGAKMVTSADDILELFGIMNNEVKTEASRKDWPGIRPEEKEILANLGNDPIHLDELAYLTKLDIKIINGTLSMLEIKGIIRNIGGGNYIITN